MIPSDHNWIQATRYPAPTLIILFITANHTHPSLCALYDLHQILILVKVLFHRVKDVSECHLLPHEDIYISKHTTLLA